ncbi:hypothetical protein [Parvularcula oceani]|uniref:hypothetical protein n=1 Tax=Parvularcula oceani TaxID=1247963 RepID=UPI00068AFD1B|nr:hypothetical protein [Parvularcula oceani]
MAIRRVLTLGMALTALASCASGERSLEAGPAEEESAVLTMMMMGGAKASDAQVAAIEARGPLGSLANPVRAHMPQGQRSYMRSLRCPGGAAPESSRIGAAGPSPYGGITDVYEWSCPGGAEGEVHIDMYHPDHVETRAPDGQALHSRNEV